MPQEISPFVRALVRPVGSLSWYAKGERRCAGLREGCARAKSAADTFRADGSEFYFVFRAGIPLCPCANVSPVNRDYRMLSAGLAETGAMGSLDMLEECLWIRIFRFAWFTGSFSEFLCRLLFLKFCFGDFVSDSCPSNFSSSRAFVESSYHKLHVALPSVRLAKIGEQRMDFILKHCAGQSHIPLVSFLCCSMVSPLSLSICYRVSGPIFRSCYPGVSCRFCQRPGLPK